MEAERTRADVQDFLNEELREPLAAMEERRLEKLAVYQRVKTAATAAGIFIGVSGCVLVAIAGTSELFLYAVPYIVGAIVALGTPAVARKRLFGGEFRDRFKETVVRPLVRFVEPSFDYSPDGYVPRELFEQSGLFQTRATRYTGDDLVTGESDGNAVQFSEIDASYTVRSKDTSSTRTLHKGLFFVAELGMPLSGFTAVVPRRESMLNLFKRTGDRAEKMKRNLALMAQVGVPPWNPSSCPYGDITEIELDNPDFHAQFHVYTTNEVEARYILSPAMTARIAAFRTKMLELQQAMAEDMAQSGFFQVIDHSKIESAMLQLSFVGSRLYVAKGSFRDLFEPDVFTPFTDHAQLHEYYDDLVFARGLIEDLKLNTW